MLKKRIVPLLLTAAILFLCSCSSRALQLTKITSEENEKVQTMSQEIIRCLTEKDKEAFNALFCEQVKNTDKFAGQVDELFDFFQCDTYIKSEICMNAGGGSETDEGKRIKWYVFPEITYISVLVSPDGNSDNMYNRYYGVNYHWQITDAKNPTLEGLHNITVELLNTDKTVTVGTNEFLF